MSYQGLVKPVVLNEEKKKQFQVYDEKTIEKIQKLESGETKLKRDDDIIKAAKTLGIDTTGERDIYAIFEETRERYRSAITY